MAVGDLLTGMPIAMENPGVDPQDMPRIEENKSLWRTYIDKVQSDPNMRQALFAAGINMLRSPGFGQNRWDTTANALASGMSTYQQGRQFDAQQAMQQQKLGLEGRQVAVQEQTGAAGVKKTESDIKTGEANSAAYTDATQQQIASSKAKDVREDAAAALNADLAPRETAAKEKSAEADIIRANAYKDTAATGKGSVGQNVQLVNQRKAAIMALNPGMSDEEATLKAQNDVLFTKKGGNNVASIAAQLYKTNLEAWQGSFDNLGETPTPEVNARIKQQSMEQAKEFAKLNGEGTPTTSTSGKIDRGAPVMPAGEEGPAVSLVGKKVAGADGSFAEIVSEDAGSVTVKLPNGRTAVIPKDVATPHIIAE